MPPLVDGKPVIELQRWLSAIRFPARKDEIIHAARQKGAPNDIIENLQRMTVNDFQSAEEVIDAYGTM